MVNITSKQTIQLSPKYWAAAITQEHLISIQEEAKILKEARVFSVNDHKVDIVVFGKYQEYELYYKLLEESFKQFVGVENIKVVRKHNKIYEDIPSHRDVYPVYNVLDNKLVKRRFAPTETYMPDWTALKSFFTAIQAITKLHPDLPTITHLLVYAPHNNA